MSDNINKGAGMRGFALQCPWSNCFPQLYDNLPRPPCSNTPFANFREMMDHIWKYHSYLLSCDSCNYRFSEAKRGEKHRAALARLKGEHDKKYHPDKSKDLPRSPQDLIKTMTHEQDEILQNWKVKKGNEDTVDSNYESLCSSLFGNGIGIPVNIRYNYWLAEHTVNPESAELGKRNEAYFCMQRRIAAQPALTAGFDHQLDPQDPPNPLSLDNNTRQPIDWVVTKTAPDSGYESNQPFVSRGNMSSGDASLQATHSAYITPEWVPFGYAHGGNSTYFEEAMYRPESVNIEYGDENWELNDSNGQGS